MNNKSFEQELSLSLLSEKELQEELANLENLFQTNLSFKKIQLLRNYIIEEEPQRIYSQYHPEMLNILYNIEQKYNNTNMFNNRDSITKKTFEKFDDNLSHIFQNIVIIDYRGNELPFTTEWESLCLQLDNDNEIFSRFLNEALLNYLNIYNLKGRIIEESSLDTEGAFRKSKKIKYGKQGNLSIENLIYDNQNSGMHLRGEEEGLNSIQYSFTKGNKDRRIFTFFSLISLKEINIFSMTLKSLKSVTESESPKNNGFINEIEEVVKQIETILEKKMLIWDAGVSFKISETNDFSAGQRGFRIGEVSNNISLQPLWGTGWRVANTAFSLKENYYIQNYELISKFISLMGKQLDFLESSKRNKKEPNNSGFAGINYNNYDYAKSSLNAIYKQIKNANHKNFPILKNPHDKSWIWRKESLTKFLALMRDINLTKEVDSLNKLTQIPPIKNIKKNLTFSEMLDLIGSENQIDSFLTGGENDEIF